MTKLDIARQRLQQQQLLQPVFTKPEEVVGWLGAVQAQDYGAAKWAVAQRSTGLTDVALDEALASGAILRTHLMRPTWHFVTSADIRWMLSLTAPRIKAFNAYYYRRLELDQVVFAQSNAVLVKALQGGKQLTRSELGVILQNAGIDTHELMRLTYIMLNAELDGIVCSGGRRGKQFTYALLDERAPELRPLEPKEALAELIRRYFTGHGPATINDFVWWSGLPAADVKAGLKMISPELAHEMIDDQTYWFPNTMPPAARVSPVVHLLPNYDEYIVGYTDRTAAFNVLDTKMANPRYNIVFNPVLVIDGRVSGTWKRTINKGQVLLTISTFTRLSTDEENGITTAVRRYGEFQATPVLREYN